MDFIADASITLRDAPVRSQLRLLRGQLVAQPLQCRSGLRDRKHLFDEMLRALRAGERRGATSIEYTAVGMRLLIWREGEVLVIEKEMRDEGVGNRSIPAQGLT